MPPGMYAILAFKYIWEFLSVKIFLGILGTHRITLKILVIFIRVVGSTLGKILPKSIVWFIDQYISIAKWSNFTVLGSFIYNIIGAVFILYTSLFVNVISSPFDLYFLSTYFVGTLVYLTLVIITHTVGLRNSGRDLEMAIESYLSVESRLELNSLAIGYKSNLLQFLSCSYLTFLERRAYFKNTYFFFKIIINFFIIIQLIARISIAVLIVITYYIIVPTIWIFIIFFFKFYEFYALAQTIKYILVFLL